MRLWSLHPEYLDRQGLLAAWREGLLAQKVLEGKTKGYRHHPQLERFRAARDPVRAVGSYLRELAREASRRDYVFDESKIRKTGRVQIFVTKGQVAFEAKHLLRKLRVRDPERYLEHRVRTKWRTHPLFRSRPGAIEKWERP